MKKNHSTPLPVKTIEKVSSKIQETTVSKRVRTARSVTLRTYFAIGVTAFIILAYFAHTVNYFPIDVVLTTGIQSFHPVWFDLLMKASSYIGYNPQAEIMIVVITALMFLLGLRFEAVVSFSNAVLITLINLVLKDIVNRPRPSINLVRVFSHVTESSFPSGHVMFYTAFFGYLLFLVVTMLKKSTYRTILIIFLSVNILLIGPSRIYLGAHWSSDVFGAYLFSSIWLLIVIYVHNWGKPRFFVKQPIAPEKVK